MLVTHRIQKKINEHANNTYFNKKKFKNTHTKKTKNRQVCKKPYIILNIILN